MNPRNAFEFFLMKKCCTRDWNDWQKLVEHRLVGLQLSLLCVNMICKVKWYIKMLTSQLKQQCQTLHLTQWTVLHSGMTDITNTYQMSTLSQMSTGINKHLQTAEQTIIREGANRTSLCWTSSRCCRACLLWRCHSGRLTARPWSDHKGCDGWMKGLHQKVLMETSWTWNTSLSVKTTEEREWGGETDTDT